MSYDAILVPTDESDHAARATAHARSLATRFDAEVHALAVVDVAAAAGPVDAGGVETEFVDRLHDRAEAALDGFADEWDGDQRLHRAVRKGRTPTVILDYLRDHDVDLVAMGTHGRTGLRRFVLGSVTEHVLRQSPVPVLATRATDAEQATEYSDVLVPTDGSEGARIAVDHALAIASAYDARLHAVHFVDEGTMWGAPGGTVPSEYLDSLEAAGADATEAIADRARDAGVPVTTAVEHDRPSKGITAYTAENDIGLVAMGTHGRSGFERVVLGSTTERVVRRSEVPVVAVPSDRTASE